MKKVDAARALKLAALAEGMSVETVRKEIKLAMLAGLCNQDPLVQARWKEIPCKGEVPAPEELIAFLAAKIDAASDPFA